MVSDGLRLLRQHGFKSARRAVSRRPPEPSAENPHAAPDLRSLRSPVAALTMDKLGRKTIQVLGFVMMAAAFLAMALVPQLEQRAVPFVVIYGISFFFTRFGPNATTFVYPQKPSPFVCAQRVMESQQPWGNWAALSVCSRLPS